MKKIEPANDIEKAQEEMYRNIKFSRDIAETVEAETLEAYNRGYREGYDKGLQANQMRDFALPTTGGSDSSPVLKGQPPVNEGYASIKDYFEEKYLIKLQEIGKDVSRLDADSLMVHFHDWVWSFIEQQLTKSQEKTIEEIKMLVETESDCIEDGNTLSPEEQELAIEVCTNILGRIDGQFDISQLTEKEIENEN